MRTVMRHGLAALMCAALVACGGGGGSDAPATPSPTPTNQAPTVAALASGDVRANASGGLALTMGGSVRLDASGSTDPERDVLSFDWSITSRPIGSTALLSAATGPTVEFKPDQMGVYTLTVKVTDAKGATSSQTLNVTVDNSAPSAGVVVTPSFAATPITAPTQSITVGSTVVLDGNKSTDPEGDPVTLNYTLTEKPVGSLASLTTALPTARFSADLPGQYTVRVRGDDGRGAYFESVYSFQANNRAPAPVVVTQVGAVVENGGSQSVEATVGYDVLLDASKSTDTENQTLTFKWAMTGMPTGSSASIATPDAVATSFSPDVLGTYTVTLTATDSAGAQTTRTLEVRVNNRRPTADISTNVSPQAIAAVPKVRLPLGTEVTLRGSASTDADGDALTHNWTLESFPTGSTAALATPNAADTAFTPDRTGSYGLRLRVVDAKGAFSERTLTLEVGGSAPVAVLDRSRMTVLVGSAAALNAALSYDEDRDALSYSWTLDARPTGSAVSLPSNTSSALSFTPDVEGTYIATVTVRAGGQSSVAQSVVVAKPVATATNELGFAPDVARYSKGLDRLVMVATNPNSLRVLDPFTGAQQNLALPAGATGLQLSPNGKWAVVAHDAQFSLVNLETMTLVRTTGSVRPVRAALVNDSGDVFATANYVSYAESQPLVFKGATGEQVTQTVNGYYTYYSGLPYGLMLNDSRKIIWSDGSTLYVTAINPTSLQVSTESKGNPSGAYFSGAFATTEDQSLLFTSNGNYVRTDTFQQAGKLPGVDRPLEGLSHHAASEELIALTKVFPADCGYYCYDANRYPSSYKRFTGSLLLADADLSLPLIGGLQSYALNVFHSAAGKHVVLVQTGGDTVRPAGVKFYVIVR